jgi:hypothetical protein
MTTITINKNTKAGKTLLELARLLAISNKGVTIDESDVNSEDKNIEKKLTSKQEVFIARLKKIKEDVDSGTYKGQSLHSFLNEI